MTLPDLQESRSSLGDPEFPFCSERCRMIDLGNWATEKYVISTPAQPPHDREPEDG